MAAVRMKDVANSINVSVVTVSKALRNHDDISKRRGQSFCGRSATDQRL
jgi:hypothetical protein